MLLNIRGKSGKDIRFAVTQGPNHMVDEDGHWTLHHHPFCTKLSFLIILSNSENVKFLNESKC